MFPFCQNYVWKEGKPCGVGKVLEPSSMQVVYRVVADPYRKWISVEAYRGKVFDRVIYDSRFLDFRKLTKAEQAAWRKESIDENNSWIFNEDDRLILKGCVVYEQGMCRAIKIFTPYDNLVCRYEMAEGPLGEVILYDSNDRGVMRREKREHASAPFQDMPN